MGGQPADVDFRRLERDDLALLGDIDRTETIEVIYIQRGSELEERRGDWSAPRWHGEGAGEHSVEGQRRACESYLDSGATAVGAFVGARLVGIGIVKPHLRPELAQLAYLHVSAEERGRGIGAALTSELEKIARAAGDTAMVVSATPSANTVGFYRSRAFEPMADPLPELYSIEPEDVHMRKQL